MRTIVAAAPWRPAIGLDRKKRLTIESNDGITRTYWLLAYDCRSFPVEISRVEEANLLAEHAGVGMVSFKGLFA